MPEATDWEVIMLEQAKKIKVDYKKFSELFIKTCNDGNQDNPELVIAVDISDNDLDVRTHAEIYNDWVELANFRGIVEAPIDEYDVSNWFDLAWEERKSTDLSDWLCEDVQFEFVNK